MEKYAQAIERLKRYDQSQIIPLIEKLDESEMDEIIKQINHLNFKKVNQLYADLSKKEKTNSDGIEEIIALNKDKLTEGELKNYQEVGENVLKNEQYAVVTMSGGQGTRLGYDGPKGTYQIDISPKPKYLFELLADSLIQINQTYHIVIPWYIMTSEENNDQIIDFFEEHQYFHYPKDEVKFFKQGNLPLLTEEGKLMIGNKKLIKEAADGNGGIFSAMHQHGILNDMIKRKIKWIFIGSIDNVLLQLADTVLLGMAESRKVKIATKSILKNSPEEKVGAICKQKGKIRVIEYSEMSEEMKHKMNKDGELAFGESHIMCNLFHIKALKKLARKKLPYHIAHKKADYLNEDGVMLKPEVPNAYKFETFIFDAWMYFKEIAVLRGKREEDFAPVKNREGVDSPETAIELYNNYHNSYNEIHG